MLISNLLYASMNLMLAHEEGIGVTFKSLCGDEGKIWIPTISFADFLFP